MSKPIDEDDEFEEFEQEGMWSHFPKLSCKFVDWPVPADGAGKKWTENWEDADWDDEDPDDNFQQRLKDEIKKALERNQSPQKAK